MRDPDWIVLDIDGVLIDVTESYDVAVKRTYEALIEDPATEVPLPLHTIRNFREKGKFGDDYKVTEGLVLAGLDGRLKNLVEEFPAGEDLDWMENRVGKSIDSPRVKRTFDRIYLGGADSPTDKGLWTREQPLVDISLLKEVETRFNLGYVTGRSNEELELAARILDYELSDAVTRDNFLKPDYRALSSLVGEARGIYAGDTLNDRMLVDNYNERTSGRFEFVLVDEDNPINRVLYGFLERKD